MAHKTLSQFIAQRCLRCSGGLLELTRVLRPATQDDTPKAFELTVKTAPTRFPAWHDQSNCGKDRLPSS
jgi:hypothetical protein